MKGSVAALVLLLLSGCIHTREYPARPAPPEGHIVALASKQETGSFVQSALSTDWIQGRDEAIDALWANRTHSSTTFRDRMARRFVVLARVESGVFGVALSMSSDGFAVLPREILQRSVRLKGQFAPGVRTTIDGFFEALSVALARSGHATGLVLFDNGNAMAIDIHVGLEDLNSLEIRTRFLQARAFTSADFEIRLAPCGVVGVETKTTEKKADGWTVSRLIR